MNEKKQVNQSFGQRLRELRMGRDMMAKELAEITKIPTTVISRYENDKRVPGWENMRRILDALAVTSDDFAGYGIGV